jgi:hypothetical protein
MHNASYGCGSIAKKVNSRWLQSTILNRSFTPNSPMRAKDIVINDGELCVAVSTRPGADDLQRCKDAMLIAMEAGDAFSRRCSAST